MYSIESFINYVYEDDIDYATEGMISNAWEWIKKQLKRLKEFLFRTIPLKLKSFLDKHPKLRDKPIVKSIYTKLKKLEVKTKETENKVKENENLITKQSEYSQGSKQKEVINEVIDVLKMENSDYTGMAYTATPDDVKRVDKAIKRYEESIHKKIQRILNEYLTSEEGQELAKKIEAKYEQMKGRYPDVDTNSETKEKVINKIEKYAITIGKVLTKELLKSGKFKKNELTSVKNMIQREIQKEINELKSEFKGFMK